VIEECVISGDCFSEVETEKISSGLLNKRHYFEEINRVIKNFQVESLDEMVLACF
jgi:hypothetical protein